jgi:DNA-binding HxlR family transcriptional regulator
MTEEPLNGRTEPATAGQWRPAIPLVRFLARRWTLAVLAGLLERGRRYQDLHDALDDISYKVLTETLRRAERDGLVAGHLDGARVETATPYELTDLGLSGPTGRCSLLWRSCCPGRCGWAGW